jgi:predicted  nucleic acid-binding Zn-ribbon protein
MHPRIRQRIVARLARNKELRKGREQIEELRALSQQMAQERRLLLDQITQLRQQFAVEVKALTTELRAAQEELHRLRAVDAFSRSERDYNVPLQ